MPYAYIKVYRTFFTGSMYSEALPTKALFLALLFECSDGVFVGTNDYLCRFTNLTPEVIAAALEALQRPDANSTSQEYDGRRIVRVEGVRNTWRIVNWAKYQPALSSEWKDKPGLTAVDPDTGEGVERLLPNGQKNPKYQKLYQRAYRAHQKQRCAAAAALEADIATIGVNSVNNVNRVNPKSHATAPSVNSVSSRVNRVSQPEKAEPCVNSDQAEGALFEPENGLNSVNSVNNVNKRKVNKRKEKKREDVQDIPPPKGVPPPGAGLVKKPRALNKGRPENAETWGRFDQVYPRPSNGRQLARAPARLTWDRLAAAGEDLEIIIDGAKRYRDWINKLDKGEYVAMMTTWLNQRRWEETHEVAPNSVNQRRPPKYETMSEELARITRGLL